MPENRPRQRPLPLREHEGEPDSLEALIAASAPAIEYLARAPAAAAGRARFPGLELARRGEALHARMTAGAQRDRVAQLCQDLRELDDAGRPNRSEQAQRCLQLLRELQSTPSPEIASYRATTEGIEDAFGSLRQSVQFVPGVGPRRAEMLRRFRIATVEDLLYHLPFRYEDRRTLMTIRELRPGESGSVCGELVHLGERHVGRHQRRLLEGVLKDESGLLALTWFNQISYFRTRFQVGHRYVAYGRVEPVPGGQKRVVHPEMHPAEESEGQGILPVYNKPTNVTVGAMRKIVAAAVETWGERLVSALPPEVAAEARIVDLSAAMQLVHEPAADAEVEALNACRSLGHRSIVFDELFFLQLGMLLRRRGVKAEAGVAMQLRRGLSDRLIAQLPFKLTVAQQRVLNEVQRDMVAPTPMHRLVQGDVGSGKTVVALLAALLAIENGFQAAFMAPTELLAEQHGDTLRRYAEPLGVKVALLTGALSRAQRRPLLEGIEAGEIQLVAGTHALIQEGVRFRRLGLGVIDEQHRFGVLQRAALRRLGPAAGEAGDPVMPDMLLMTATPIPRTLAMTVYGDLDVSVLDQLPPGRRPVRTQVFTEAQRARAYAVVRGVLERGQQAYVVFPLVEGSEDSDLRDASSMARELAQTVFAGRAVGLVHGKMKPAEKDQVMRRFKAGDLQVLVSTTVIEVGIDVANATAMVVEHADRFGLAQLHQLRGRVGRGGEASFCLLIAPVYQGDDAYRRLQAMTRTNDGFAIADLDLEMRGPGEMLGTRQSGLPDFRAANLVRDRSLLLLARQAAETWLQRDPELRTPPSRALKAVLKQRWAGRLELAEVG